MRQAAFLTGTLAGLAVGALSWLFGATAVADGSWAVTTAGALVPATWWVLVKLRQRQAGVDLIAVLALAGTLAVGEYVAGALIAVMLATGRELEARAAARAQRDLTALLAGAPRVAHRYDGAALASLPLAEVRAGDLLLVKPGEVVPVDGRVEGGRAEGGRIEGGRAEHGVAVLDESALSGEPVPVERRAGDAVRSGAVNAGGPFDLRATTTAEESTYAGIVRLVAGARADSAPFVRMADRYAAAFLPLSLAVAGLAWALSGDPVRAVAVLVVATPCPLILAAPVAIVSGLSRAAHLGVIVKGGGALERLAAGRVLLFDKTGTLTAGRPTVTEVIVAPGTDTADVLRLAASLDQVSPHVLAAAVVRAANGRGLALSLPTDTREVAGAGVRGTVDGHAVSIGKARFVASGPLPPWLRAARRRSALDGSILIFVGVDDRPAGALLLDDPIRPEAPRMIRRLREAGIRRIVMVTGDRAEVAEAVGAALGVDTVLAERAPADKVAAVREYERDGVTIMVGDGVNDAPALAAAGVGVAIGARGSTASSEAADVVLTSPRLDRLARAVEIARRSRRIALQSVWAGMGMSLVAMGAAAVGWLPPAFGALLQEGIDVVVILNALRALRDGRAHRPLLAGPDAELSRRFAGDHVALRPDLDQIRSAAAAFGSAPAADALVAARAAYRVGVDRLLPHEDAESEELYPVLNRVLGGDDPTGTMSRAHLEIHRLVGRLGRLLDEVGDGVPDADDVREFQQVLYGLDAVLRLHFAQEEEGYFTLADDEAPLGGATPPAGGHPPAVALTSGPVTSRPGD